MIDDIEDFSSDEENDQSFPRARAAPAAARVVPAAARAAPVRPLGPLPAASASHSNPADFGINRPLPAASASHSNPADFGIYRPNAANGGTSSTTVINGGTSSATRTTTTTSTPLPPTRAPATSNSGFSLFSDVKKPRQRTPSSAGAAAPSDGPSPARKNFSAYISHDDVVINKVDPASSSHPRTRPFRATRPPSPPPNLEKLYNLPTIAEEQNVASDKMPDASELDRRLKLPQLKALVKELKLPAMLGAPNSSKSKRQLADLLAGKVSRQRVQELQHRAQKEDEEERRRNVARSWAASRLASEKERLVRAKKKLASEDAAVVRVRGTASSLVIPQHGDSAVCTPASPWKPHPEAALEYTPRKRVRELQNTSQARATEQIHEILAKWNKGGNASIAGVPGTPKAPHIGGGLGGGASGGVFVEIAHECQAKLSSAPATSARQAEADKRNNNGGAIYLTRKELYTNDQAGENKGRMPWQRNEDAFL